MPLKEIERVCQPEPATKFTASHATPPIKSISDFDIKAAVHKVFEEDHTVIRLLEFFIRAEARAKADADAKLASLSSRACTR